MGYRVIESAKPVKVWDGGGIVPVQSEAIEQLRQVARLPFVHRHVAAMPDVHYGLGATVGSVIALKGAVVPAAVGVDIGCGMVARQLPGVDSRALGDSAALVREVIEQAVPAGRNSHEEASIENLRAYASELRSGEYWIRQNKLWDARQDPLCQLGTLGGGNHFVEVCLDEDDRVWVMLHSGSRGVGNRIGSHYIGVAQRECERWGIRLPNRDLAYLPEGTPGFSGYVQAMEWAQEYARVNRECMLRQVLSALRAVRGFEHAADGSGTEAINCHHNYMAREHHFGENVWVTRKGAVRAREGDLGIIPGSMGARSYIVRGRGCAESFHSCSHGAGRTMSRSEAKRRFTLEDHERATVGIECRKDSGVLDETPGAYKDIDAVMAAQDDLVEVVHELSQVVCVKG